MAIITVTQQLTIQVDPVNGYKKYIIHPADSDVDDPAAVQVSFSDTVRFLVAHSKDLHDVRVRRNLPTLAAIQISPSGVRARSFLIRVPSRGINRAVVKRLQLIAKPGFGSHLITMQWATALVTRVTSALKSVAPQNLDILEVVS